MTHQNELPERRKFTRFQVKNRSFALNTKFGPVVDISMDGLTFLHMPYDLDSKESIEKGMLFAGEKLYCDDLPVTVITDQTVGDGSARLRRGGLQFGELSQEQLSRLERFIVKGRRVDSEKLQPTSEDLAARVSQLEIAVKKLTAEQQKDTAPDDPSLKEPDEGNKEDSFLLICSHCKDVKDAQDNWQKVEQYVGEHLATKFSHGMCPKCSKKYYPKFFDSEE